MNEVINFEKLPKVELHLHLEGAARPYFIKDLALKKGIDVQELIFSNETYKFESFESFLSLYEKVASLLRSPYDYYKLTAHVLKECAKNNIIYVETFISPDFCGECDVIAWKEYCSAICEAADEAEREYGIIWRGIPTCIRHFGAEAAKKSAICAVSSDQEKIAGFGMGGDENCGFQRDFQYSFDLAREAGLRLTSHAGEWCSSFSVKDAIDSLKVERVGHGISAIEDNNLISILIDKGVTLEVCPGSNVCLGIFESIHSHPIDRLKNLGVQVTVSTDDPPFFSTNMNQEYLHLQKAFGWTKSDFKDLNIAALDASFSNKQTKDRLKKYILDKYTE